MSEEIGTTESTGTEEGYTLEDTAGAVEDNNTEGNIDGDFNQDYADDFSVPTGQETDEDGDLVHDEDSEIFEEEYTDEELNDSMMDYIRENFDMPDKFKDVGSMIESYKHLEQKMGNFKGAPEQYELDETVFNNYSEDMLGSFSEMG